MRLLPASASALLVELEDLSRMTALLSALQARPLDGVRDLVPGARTLLIEFDPQVLTRAALVEALAVIARSPADPRAATSGERIDIPVHYDGEDLGEVAALLGLSVEDVVRRHTGTDWRVAFTGFAPGFAYLTEGDPLLRQIPRRSSPRIRIPPGAVAVAGGFSGVYPKASPGGWQLLGQTFTPMWDLDRDPPALLQPGQRVRFVDAGPRAVEVTPTVTQVMPPTPAPETAEAPATTTSALPTGSDVRPGLSIVGAGLQSLLQDLGRLGRAGQGVSASGAMDRGSLRDANRLVGNAPHGAAIETVQGGLELRSHGATVVAVTGAEGPLTLTTPDGREWPMARHAPLALNDGDRLRIGEPTAGLRSYVAVRGGFDRALVLGSLSFDTLAEVGPAPLKAGDHLDIGSTADHATAGDSTTPRMTWPRVGEVVTLDLQAGPRTDWFTAEALDTLTGQDWTVTPQSNRVGVRLSGTTPLARAITTELPSEGTALGALQVPASGQPVLFLADHPLTGGYPVIACVAPWHLDLAGQIPVGARIRFRIVADFAPITLPSASPETSSIDSPTHPNARASR